MSESLYSPQKQTPEDQAVLHAKHHEAPLTRRQNLLRHGVPIAAVGGAVLVAAFGPSIAHGLDNINQQNTCVAGPESVTVGAGDSLWGIASKLDTTTDVNLTASRLAEVNNIPDSVIHSGEVLSVPVCGPDINQ